MSIPIPFTVPIVFKTSLEAALVTLPICLPTAVGIGLLSRVSQTMRELNPNLHIDSVICKPLHYIAYVEPLGIEPRLLP